MSGEGFGWVLDGMPHRPPMRLIDEVLEAGGGRLVARARIGEGHVLLGERGVSPLAAVELFAQAAAALMVFRAGPGAPPAPGYLLGTRKLEMHAERFAAGDELLIRVTEVWGTGPLAQYDGELLRDGELVARGSINVAAG